MNKTTSPGMNMAAILAATMGALGRPLSMSLPREPKERKRVPTMVTSSPAEIAAWNDGVDQRKAARGRSGGKFRVRVRASGQYPKFPKARVHKQAKHPLRDEHGAYTLIGKPYELVDIHPTSSESVLRGGVDPDGGFDYTVQRKWLGGISAQRGY